ncbi:MAG: hypothetical protein KJP00_00750 [Bacteroidia bacterium]|nr:hypothetical protein [Bacteroidia bacterium]
MDGFEKHIRSNRDQFDEHRADKEKMWKHISSELNDEKPVIPLWRRNWFQIAAGFLMLLGIVGLLRMNTLQDQMLAQNAEMIEIDFHYEKLVAHHVQMVYDNPNLSESEKQEFLDFMNELDEEYELLKEEMESNLDNEKVLEAIIDNYKKRIEIIENLLLRINQTKNTNHEKGIHL